MIPNLQSGSSTWEYFNVFSFIGGLIPSLGFLFKLIHLQTLKSFHPDKNICVAHPKHKHYAKTFF